MLSCVDENLLDMVRMAVVCLLHNSGAVLPGPDLPPQPVHLDLEVLIPRPFNISIYNLSDINNISIDHISSNNISINNFSINDISTTL